MQRYNIDTCALLVEFNASVWTARKLDRGVTDEIIYEKGAGAKDAARVNKHLLAGRPELEVIQKHVGMIRTFVYDNTLPWSDAGPRLLPTVKFLMFNDRMAEFENEFNSLVNRFVTIYPTIITAQAMALGDMFNRDDYPSDVEMAHKFSFRLNYLPVPKAGDFRVDVGNDAQDELQKRLARMADERIESAMKEARQRLKAHMDRMMERLKVEEINGKVTKFRIHDSLIEGGLELCDILQALNLTKDPDLEAARVRLEKVLRSVDVDDLRKHDGARTEVRTQVAEIMDKFKF